VLRIFSKIITFINFRNLMSQVSMKISADSHCSRRQPDGIFTRQGSGNFK
jgi:hypothetical protein